MNYKLCFYCEKEIATRNRILTAYKVVQRFSQEKLRYVEFNFSIRVCDKCDLRADKNKRIESKIFTVSLVLSVIVSTLYWIITDEFTSDEIFAAIFTVIFTSLIFSSLLRGIAFLIFYIINIYTNRDTEIKNSSHPFVEILKEHNWYLDIPHPKYDIDKMSDDILDYSSSQDCVLIKQEEFLKDVRNLYEKYLKSFDATT